MIYVKILAIETSCDETAVAVLTEENSRPLLLSNIISSQINIHASYGGVVPEVAARAHLEDILPVVTRALREAQTELKDIDYLAFTYGPGLIGSLVVGVETAKALSVAHSIPLVPVNHLEGHIYANFLEESVPEFPILALLVSGGHTQLILVKSHLEYCVVGQTWDDAAGEAFDKAAKAMGLGYPGGPIISKLAEAGNSKAFELPLVDLTPAPQRNEEGFLEKSEPSLDFSFSGLKTALIGKVKAGFSEEQAADLAASFEQIVVDTLIQNSLRAVERYQPKSFILSGGVAANRNLRASITKNITSKGVRVYVPSLDFCTDNAAMIGAAAFYHIKEKKIGKNTEPDPGAKL
jgi:N6-L-threonylcarbamoyladenine synthase